VISQVNCVIPSAKGKCQYLFAFRNMVYNAVMLSLLFSNKIACNVILFKKKHCYTNNSINCYHNWACFGIFHEIIELGESWSMADILVLETGNPANKEKGFSEFMF